MSKLKWYQIVFILFLNASQSYAQFTFNIKTKDTIFIDEQRVHINLNGISLNGSILSKVDYGKYLIIGISPKLVGLIEFDESFVEPYKPINLINAKTFVVSQNSIKRKLSQGYYLPIPSLFSELSPEFDYKQTHKSVIQEWYSPKTYEDYSKKLELERNREIKIQTSLRSHDSITEITKYYGIYSVELIFRDKYDVSNLSIQGKIYFSENGITLKNVESMYENLSCSVDKSSSITPRKGQFILSPNKSVYNSGSIVLGEGTGAVSFEIGKRITTTTFKILNFTKNSE
jgi:hypothetical protein